MSAFIPYGHQTVDEHDVAAVAQALREELITQGPRVEAFERAFAHAVHASHAVAFSSGTAALHGAVAVCEIARGCEALTTPISFVASSNCLLYSGLRPRFADIDPDTFNLDVAGALAGGLMENVAAVVTVSMAGLPADLASWQSPRARGVWVIEDASHALGAWRDGRPVGGDGLADMSVFSLHPVKSITTGEGGVVTTESAHLAERLRAFRTHGIVRPSQDARAVPVFPSEDGIGGGDESFAADERTSLHGRWHYDVQTLGFNYRITDFQCALGHSQLGKLESFIAARNQIADSYRQLLADVEGLSLPTPARSGDLHAYHLFVVRFHEGARRRKMVCERLYESGVGTQLHYIPIYRHTLYRSLGYGGLGEQLPNAERYYRGALSLPIFPAMSERDVVRVADALRRVMLEPLDAGAEADERLHTDAAVRP